MILKSNYYLGTYTSYNKYSSYKETICKDSNLTKVTTNNCTKYTSKDKHKVYNGYIGLPRVGEMFSTQINDDGYKTATKMMMITPRSVNEYDEKKYYLAMELGITQNGELRTFEDDDNDGVMEDNEQAAAARPTFYLSSKVRITSGSGTKNNPFKIAM